ncbi:4Fe-4S dicluster domain-containing protein [Thermodesulfobacteriota bacterium B35]
MAVPPAGYFMNGNNRPIGPRRTRLQWILTLLFLLAPWFKVDGRSLVRIDIPGQRLYLAGQVLRIEELYLVLLAVLVFILTFLLVTVILGRVWCGWLCPQTTFSDLAQWLARTLGLRVRHNRLQGELWRRALLQPLFLIVALVSSCGLLWYFIPPQVFFARLSAFDLPAPAWITLGLVTLVIYLDLALVRRLVCRDFCPYGRIQTALISPVTLTLHLPPEEQANCIDCGACVRACPMEIDIRQGLQVECISCARCLDACRRVMAGRNRPGLIRYTFGLEGKGIRALLDVRVLLPAAAILALLVVLVVLLGNRPVASLKVAVSHTAPQRRLADGRIGTFFNAWVHNRGRQEATYIIRAMDAASGSPLILKGQTRIKMAAGRNRRLDFILITPRHGAREVRFILEDSSGRQVAGAGARVVADMEKAP